MAGVRNSEQGGGCMSPCSRTAHDQNVPGGPAQSGTRSHLPAGNDYRPQRERDWKNKNDKFSRSKWYHYAL